MVFLSDETNPAAEIPTESTVYLLINSRATSAMTAVRASPPSRGVSRRASTRISPEVFTTPPRTFVPPTSMPIV